MEPPGVLPPSGSRVVLSSAPPNDEGPAERVVIILVERQAGSSLVVDQGHPVRRKKDIVGYRDPAEVRVVNVERRIQGGVNRIVVNLRVGNRAGGVRAPEGDPSQLVTLADAIANDVVSEGGRPGILEESKPRTLISMAVAVLNDATGASAI